MLNETLRSIIDIIQLDTELNIPESNITALAASLKSAIDAVNQPVVSEISSNEFSDSFEIKAGSTDFVESHEFDGEFGAGFGGAPVASKTINNTYENVVIPANANIPFEPVEEPSKEAVVYPEGDIRGLVKRLILDDPAYGQVIKGLQSTPLENMATVFSLHSERTMLAAEIGIMIKEIDGGLLEEMGQDDYLEYLNIDEYFDDGYLGKAINIHLR
jgi:hypothetical protein